LELLALLLGAPGLTLQHNIRQERLAGANTAAYFGQFVSYDVKMFYKLIIGSWSSWPYPPT
jgi:hypothetical protein